MIKVAIVDDHKMFRDSMTYILNSTQGYEVIWSAESGFQTKQKVESDRPDVLLLDITLGEENGIVLIEELLEIDESLLVLGVSMHHEDQYIIKMIEKGAKGYVLKDSGINELKNAIEKIHSGGFFYNDLVMDTLISRVTKPSKSEPPSADDPVVLTKREIEILKLVSEELSNIEISEKLFISPRTVETHKRNMISKLNVKNSIGLVRYALKHGIVKYGD